MISFVNCALEDRGMAMFSISLSESFCFRSTSGVLFTFGKRECILTGYGKGELSAADVDESELFLLLGAGL